MNESPEPSTRPGQLHPTVTLHNYARSVTRPDGTIEIWFICNRTRAFRLWGLLTPAGAENDNDESDTVRSARQRKGAAREARKLSALGMKPRAIASALDYRGFYATDGLAFTVAEVKAMVGDV